MSAVVRTVRRVPILVLLGLLWVYRTAVSPLLPRSCRYYPSCSVYAQEALRTHGAVRGSWLAVRRLARCHPWTPGGVDHVPPRGAAPDEQALAADSALPRQSTTGA